MLATINQLLKSLLVIVMAFESLLVHTMGPKKVASCSSCSHGSQECGHTKRVNDGSGGFVNKYNRMEQQAKKEQDREGDVMGLQDADK